MALLTWNDRYKVNITTIDLQHKKLFDMINELHDAMRSGKGNEVLGKILNELVMYTRMHFATEERMMSAARYPDYANHKAQHDELTRKAVELQHQFREGRTMMTLEVMNFLKDWLTHHIQGSDRKYTPYLSGD